MRELFFLLITGLVQGLTEFLPVSSSAHLALLEEIFTFPENKRLSYTVFLHLGTLGALIIFFGKDLLLKIKRRDSPFFLKIILASLLLFLVIPFRNWVATSFSQIKAISTFLLLTGILLFATRFRQGTKEEISYPAALLCGFFQLLSVFPGISRSGATISILLLLGIKEECAYQFSFLLAIPAVTFANLYELSKILGQKDFLFHPLILLGIFLSFLSGLFALYLLKRVLIKRRFYLFSLYLFAFALFSLFVSRR
ncbi:MAG: undecaprenyl-diphosphate phosphatase [candidate division WOR-3 bacterium]